MPTYFGLTGTPGTGKKTLAPLVAARLGIRYHSLNDLAEAYGLARRATGGIEVDAAKLGRRIAASIRGPCLLYGHLFPDALGRKDVSRVVVLRCEPKALKLRLEKRGYSGSKVAENVEAELIGLVCERSVETFGSERVVEYDTTDCAPTTAADEVSNLFRRRDRLPPSIDWLPYYDSAEKLRSLLRAR